MDDSSTILGTSGRRDCVLKTCQITEILCKHILSIVVGGCHYVDPFCPLEMPLSMRSVSDNVPIAVSIPRERQGSVLAVFLKIPRTD